MSPVQVHVRYRVPYADTDQMRLVYYANYLVYFEMARNELLRAAGFPYREVEARGYALPVLEAHVRYHAAAHYDDELDIRGWLGWLKPVRLCVECAVYCGETLLAQGHTVHAFVDIARLKPVRMPDDLAAVFRAMLGPDGGAARPGAERP